MFKRVKSGQYILFFLVNLLLGLIIYTKPKYLEAKYLSFLEQTTTLDFDKGLKHFRNPNPCCKDSHPDHKSCLGHAIHTIPKNFLEIAKIYGLLHGITFLFHKDPQKFLNQVTKSIMFYMMYATVGRSVYCAHGKLVKGYYPNLVQFMVIWTVATSSVFLENKHRVPEYSLFLLSKVISGVLRICSGVKGSEYLPHDRIISSVLLGLTFVNWKQKMKINKLKSLDQSVANLLFT